MVESQLGKKEIPVLISVAKLPPYTRLNWTKTSARLRQSDIDKAFI